MAETIDEVLAFWFAEGRNEVWFVKNAAFDAEVRAFLGALFERAVAGGFDHWRESGRGCLALVILLDQVPRNLFRDDPRAYDTDEQARSVTHHALRALLDEDLNFVATTTVGAALVDRAAVDPEGERLFFLRTQQGTASELVVVPLR